MAKKQALRSVGEKWLHQYAVAFQFAKLHEGFKLLSAPHNSDFKISWTSMRITSVSTLYGVDSQPGNHSSVRVPTYSQDEGSTSDQELLSLINQRTLY